MPHLLCITVCTPLTLCPVCDPPTLYPQCALPTLYNVCAPSTLYHRVYPTYILWVQCLPPTYSVSQYVTHLLCITVCTPPTLYPVCAPPTMYTVCPPATLYPQCAPHNPYTYTKSYKTIYPFSVCLTLDPLTSNGLSLMLVAIDN